MRNQLFAGVALACFAVTPAFADLLPPKDTSGTKDVRIVTDVKTNGSYVIPADLVVEKVEVNTAREAQRTTAKEIFDDFVTTSHKTLSPEGPLGNLEGNIAVIDQKSLNNTGDIDQEGGTRGTALIVQDSKGESIGNTARIEQKDSTFFDLANELNRAAIEQLGSNQSAVIEQSFVALGNGNDLDKNSTADNYAVVRQVDSYGAHAAIVQRLDRSVGASLFVPAEFDNDAAIVQEKSDYANATIMQEGQANGASIGQFGADHADATVYQVGILNVAQVHQSNDYSRAYVVQDGLSNSAVITN